MRDDWYLRFLFLICSRLFMLVRALREKVDSRIVTDSKIAKDSTGVLYLTLEPGLMDSEIVSKRILAWSQISPVRTIKVRWHQSTFITFYHLIREFVNAPFSVLVFVHPQALGGRLRGLVLEILLRLVLRRICFVSLVFDLLDPVLGLKVLTRTFGPHRVIVLANTEKESSDFFGRRTKIRAPAAELAAPLYTEMLETREFDSRENIIYFPGRLYEARLAFLEALFEVDSELEEHIKTCFFPDRSDFLREMRACKVAMVTNRIQYKVLNNLPIRITDDTIITTHMVGKNFQVLSQGACLIAERTAALDFYLEEGHHYLGFSTPEEAAEILQSFVHSPESSTWASIAAQGKVRLEEILSQGRLRNFIV